MLFSGKPAWQSVLWALGVVLSTPVLLLLEYVIHDGFEKTQWPAAVVMSGGVVAAVVLLIAPRLGPRALPAASIGAALFTAAVYYPAGWQKRPEYMCLLLTPTAALLILLGLVVWRAAPRWVVATAVVIPVVVVAQPATGRGRLTELVFAFLLMCCVILACSIGLTARVARRARLRQIEHERLVQRTEFARDLHDFVGHFVTGMVVQARGAQAIAKRSPEDALATLDSIAEAGTEAMESLHRMVGLLRTEDGATTAPLAGIDQISTMVERFNRERGPRAQLVVDGRIEGIPVDVSSTAHRIALEGLTNVRKHGRDVTAVEIRLERSESGLTVHVGDDGAPGKISQGGFGLRGLHDRVAEIGGELENGPSPGRGWVLEARLPVPPKGDAA